MNASAWCMKDGVAENCRCDSAYCDNFGKNAEEATSLFSGSPLGTLLQRFFCCCQSSGGHSVDVNVTSEIGLGTPRKDKALGLPDSQSPRFPTAAQVITSRSVQVLRSLRPIFHGSNMKLWITLGAPPLKKKQGQWYYEVKLGHGIACSQIGWVTDRFEETETRSRLGVGNDEQSWAADGLRHKKLHNANEVEAKWPKQWCEGDIVGCAIDLDNGEMRFSQNGSWVSVADFTFQALGRFFFPAVSASGDFAFHFSARSFRYHPPSEDYHALYTTADTSHLGIFERPRKQFNGRWTDGNSHILAVIKGNLVTWPDGTLSRLIADDVSQCSMEFRGQTWHARLLADGRLAWNDGEIWWRDGDGEEVVSSDSESADEEVLKRYFLGPYRQGLSLRKNFAYSVDTSEVEELMYSHRGSGVKVWSRVLDLTPPSTPLTDVELLFHYTSLPRFRTITEMTVEVAELASTLQETSIFGKGLYASHREPAEFSSLEAVAKNCYAVQLEEDPSSLYQFTQMVRFCIPVIATKPHCFDLHKRATPEMDQGPGRTSRGKAMPTDQDLWLVNTVNQQMVKDARSNNEASLTRMVEVRRQMNRNDDPETLLSVVSLARCLRSDGKAKEASPLCARALEAHEKSLGLEDPKTLACLKALALCLADQGKDTEAELLLRRAQEGSQRVLGPEHAFTSECTSELAMRLLAKGHAKEAEELLRQSLEARQRALGADHMETLILVDRLGRVLLARGNSKEAQELYKHALDVREKSLGADHSETLEMVHGLSGCLLAQGKIQEAEPLTRRAVAGREKVLGSDHPRTLDSLDHLSTCLRSKGAPLDGEALARRVFKGREKAYGKNHARTLEAADHLGMCLLMQKKTREAESLFIIASEGREKLFGAENPDTLASAFNLAECYMANGKASEAQPLLRRVLRVREKTYGDKHTLTLDVVHKLSECFKNQNKVGEAEPLMRRAVLGRERNLGEAHPDTLDSAFNLATCLYAQGKAQAAEPLLRRVLKGLESLHGEKHQKTISCVTSLSGCLYAQGKVTEAEKLLWRSLKESEKELGAEHADTLDCVYSLAVCLDSQGKFKEAEPFYRRALQGREKVLGANHANTIIAAGGLSGCILAQNRYREAEPYLWRATEGLTKLYGKDNPNTRTCVDHLIACLEAQGRDGEVAALLRRV